MLIQDSLRESFVEYEPHAEVEYTLDPAERSRLFLQNVYSADPFSGPEVAGEHKVIVPSKAPSWVSIRPPISPTERQEGLLDILFDFMLIAAMLSLQTIMRCAISFPGLLTCFVIFVALQRLWFCFVTYVNKFEHHQLFHLILYFCGCLGMCNLSLFLQGIQNNEDHDDECYDAYFDQWEVLRAPKHFIGVYLLFQLLFMLIHFQAGYFLVRTRRHWLCLTLSFGVNAMFWALSLLFTVTTWAVPFIWIAGLSCQELLRYVAQVKYPGVPLHVPHLCARLGVFLMILLGQSTFEIVTYNNIPSDARNSFQYPVAVCLIFGISFNIAVGYFYTQPTLLQRHVLRNVNSTGRAELWLGAHIFLSFFLLLQGVGMVNSYQALENGIDKYSWLTVVGAAGARATVAFVRLCHKGWAGALRRTCGYVLRMVVPLIMLAIPWMVQLRSDKTEHVFLMLVLLFLFTLALAILDIYRRQEEEIRLVKNVNDTITGNDNPQL